MRQQKLFRAEFWAVASLGSIVIGIVCTFSPLFAQIAVVGCYLSILGGLVVSLIENESTRRQQQSELFDHLRLPHRIARDSIVFEKYEKIVRGISDALNIDDPLFRELTLERLQILGNETENLSQGRLEFLETESWRTAYEKLLRSDSVKEYLSVALVSASGYWQDIPGIQSINLNYLLQEEKGLRIERIVIVSDDLWLKDDHLPCEPTLSWIYEQHNHGIWIELVREADLVDEQGLLVDTGIYGTQAIGVQFLDESAKTLKFILSFNSEEMLLAKKRWEKLKLFSRPFRNLLDDI